MITRCSIWFLKALFLRKINHYIIRRFRPPKNQYCGHNHRSSTCFLMFRAFPIDLGCKTILDEPSAQDDPSVITLKNLLKVEFFRQAVLIVTSIRNYFPSWIHDCDPPPPRLPDESIRSQIWSFSGNIVHDQVFTRHQVYHQG